MKYTIDILTGLTKEQRKSVLSWIASLPEEEVIDIFQSSVKMSFQIRKAQPKLRGRDIKYSALIISARRTGWDTLKGKGFRVAKQKQFKDLSNIREAKFAEIVQKGRKPDLRRKVLAHWGEIKELREKGGSYNSIARYLQETRRIKVSPSYLAKLWGTIEL